MNILGLAAAVILLPLFAYSQSLSEAAFFNRCYAHLTGKPVPLNHPAMTSVQAGKVKGLDACLDILAKSQLTTAGPLVNSSNTDAQAVLNNLYRFHKTWFPANVVEQIQGFDLTFSRGTMDVYDSTEPALALTRVALMQGGKYSDVLRMATGVHAMRREDPAVKAQFGWTVTFPGRARFGNNAGYDQNLIHFRGLTGNFSTDSDKTSSSFLTMPKIEVGELIGIRTTTESLAVPNFVLETVGAGVERRANEQAGLNYTYNFYRTFGGGVLGMPIHLMLNFGHGPGTLSNATLKVPRRWAEVNIKSFLCADLPALRESDIQQLIVPTSTTAFRNSASCVTCHATLDQMAYTARNIVLGNSDRSIVSLGARAHAKAIRVVSSYNPELAPSAGWPSEAVANFHRQRPDGKLFFRSVTGELINRPVTSIAGLGIAMSETSDFYQCAAKRYFEFFTGIEVPLYDRQDPRNSSRNIALSNDAKEDRLFVERLGEELRQSGSIPRLIQSILSSSYYRDANFRTGQ